MACAECISGHVHPGRPQGRLTTLYGRETYVAEPSGHARGIIVIVPDAFGLPFVNNRLLADHYAEAGFRVYLPDFMDGAACPAWVIEAMAAVARPARGWGLYDWTITKPWNLLMAISSFLPFLIRHRDAVAWPKIRTFVQDVRDHEPLGIGAAGFCWGGPHVARLAGHEPLVDASFTAHPSNLAVPGAILALQKPLSLALGDRDFVLPPSQAERIREACRQTSIETEVVTYEKSGHGFAVRADPDTVDAMEKATRAEEQAVRWFKRHLRGAGAADGSGEGGRG